MSTIGTATLQSDENGLVTLQCDRCQSRFKVDCEYLNDTSETEICCPICGIANSINTFWPEEAIEAAKKIAMMEAEMIFAKALKGLNSKYIKVKEKTIKTVDRKVAFKDKDYDMEEVTVSCCKKKIALTQKDICAGYYCPYCGRIVE